MAEALTFYTDRKIPLHVNIGTNSAIRVRMFDIQNFDTNQVIVVTNIQAYQNNVSRQLSIRNPEREIFNEITLYDMLRKKVISKNKLQVNESYNINPDFIK